MSKTLRRSGRHSTGTYKKGDYIEFQLNGTTATGKLVQKSARGSSTYPVWIVAPSDRRRRNEELPERLLGRVIDVNEALNNRQARIVDVKNSDNAAASNTNINDEDLSLSDPSTKVTISEETTSDENSNSELSKKHKADDTFIDSEKSKRRKTVTFQDTFAKSKPTTQRIGTRSSAKGNLELAALPVKKTINKKGRKSKRKNVGKKGNPNEEVVKVKMLTGTLYLYRGERPRAEFIRTK